MPRKLKSMLGKTAIGTTSASGKVFPGQYYDMETGLHYNYFRYYDPSTGRYITSDPVGLDGGLNAYLYSEANPVTVDDPDGRNPIIKGIIKRLFSPKTKPKPNTPKPKPKPGDKPTCTLIKESAPGSLLNPMCEKCWSCTYRCTGRSIVGGGHFIQRYQIGGCTRLTGPGFVPGFRLQASCEAAAASGSKQNSFEGLYRGDAP